MRVWIPLCILCVIGALYYGLRKWDDYENFAADKFLRPVRVSENYRSFGLFIISISFKLVWSDDAERCGVGGSFCQWCQGLSFDQRSFPVAYLWQIGKCSCWHNNGNTRCNLSGHNIFKINCFAAASYDMKRLFLSTESGLVQHLTWF